MTLATLIATIAIVVDSQILVIGTRVLGPEFGALGALGVALVRRRHEAQDDVRVGYWSQCPLRDIS